MTDTIVASLATATQEENSAIKEFNGLVAAKTKQINSLGKEIESKTSRIGQMGVDLVSHCFKGYALCRRPGWAIAVTQEDNGNSKTDI